MCREEEMVMGAAPGAEALTSGEGLWTSLRRGLTRVGVGMGVRVVPRVGEDRRLGVNVGRDVNTAGSPELEGRGAGANGGTGVNPSRGACLTTIFTTPVLFTMDGGRLAASGRLRPVGAGVVLGVEGSTETGVGPGVGATAWTRATWAGWLMRWC